MFIYQSIQDESSYCNLEHNNTTESKRPQRQNHIYRFKRIKCKESTNLRRGEDRSPEWREETQGDLHTIKSGSETIRDHKSYYQIEKSKCQRDTFTKFDLCLQTLMSSFMIPNLSDWIRRAWFLFRFRKKNMFLLTSKLMDFLM